MRAVIMQGVDRPVGVEDLVGDPPGLRDVVVELKATGVCHSDLSAVRGYLGLDAPTILGHEAAGVVVEVGRQVTTVRPGDRVIASLVPVCGACYWCVDGQTHLCAEAGTVRDQYRGSLRDGSRVKAMLGLGAFAEHMTIDERQAVKIDSDLSFEELALIGCGIATGAGAALFTTRVRPGSSVAVVGCGGVGQSVIQGARVAGAATIIAIDPVPFKRTTSLKSGATETIDPADEETVDRVRELTGGRGVDYSFEAVGTPETVTVAYECARRGGVVATVGIPSPGANLVIPASDFFRAEKRMVGSYYGSTQVKSHFQLFADLIGAGKLDAAGLITRRYPLQDTPEAFAELESGQVIRAIVN